MFYSFNKKSNKSIKLLIIITFISFNELNIANEFHKFLNEWAKCGLTIRTV